MKKHVVKVLLPLLFSFCCVFSGFLSVNVKAVDYFDNAIFPDMIGVRMVAGSYSSDVNLPVEEFKWYEFDNDEISNVDYIVFRFQHNTWDIVYNYDSYDYYLYAFVIGDGENLTFRPDSYISINDANAQTHRVEYNYTDYYKYDGSSKLYGFSALVKFPEGWQNSIRGLTFSSTGSRVISSNARYLVSVIQAPKDDDLYVQGVISAINNQTSALQGSIGQAADDIQQSIEEQFSGDPETEFSVDDVISQHNEKMGVLSFGSDVMLQFLDMFQSANVGTAELTLPGFNITVENVEYSVWPDYSFNFEQLNEWVPGLMSVIRMMLPAFVWLMVLRYCVNVFEKNFLSNGG